MATNVLQTNFLQTNVLSTSVSQPNVLIRAIQPPPAPIDTGFVVTTDEVEDPTLEQSPEPLYPAFDLLGLGTPSRTQSSASYDQQKVQEIIAALVRTSSQHAVALRAKQDNEQQVTLLFSTNDILGSIGPSDPLVFP